MYGCCAERGRIVTATFAPEIEGKSNYAATLIHDEDGRRQARRLLERSAQVCRHRTSDHHYLGRDFIMDRLGGRHFAFVVFAVLSVVGPVSVGQAQRSESEEAAYELGSRLGSFVGERILWIIGILFVLYLLRQLLRRI